MKENALRPAVLETYITCLMMACDTNDRAMIESMVKAIVPEYTPQRAVETAPVLISAGLSKQPLLKRLATFKI